MAKQEGEIINLSDKITLYAPKGAAFHKEGQPTQVHPTQKAKFLKLGYTETLPKAEAKK